MRYILVMISIILISLPSCSQIDNGMNYPFVVNPGTEDIYRIRLINGKTYYAKVLELNNEAVLILNHDSDTLNIKLVEIKKLNKRKQSRIGSVGMGLGIPYGSIGANIDIKLHEYFYLSGGLGFIDNIHYSYSIGSKVFFTSENKIWRPRFSVFYSANFRGVSLGLGQQWTVGTKKIWAIDLDVQYVIPNDYFNQNSTQYSIQPLGGLSNITFSYGFRYCF